MDFPVNTGAKNMHTIFSPATATEINTGIAANLS